MEIEKSILHLSEIDAMIKSIEKEGEGMDRKNSYTPYHNHMSKILETFGADTFMKHHEGISDRFFSIGNNK